MAAPLAKHIPILEAKELLSLKREDITMDKLRDLFACHMGEESAKYNTYDILTLPAGTYYNKETIETTIGRYITNIVIFPISFMKKFGYQNDELTKGSLKKIEEKMGTMLLNDEMTTKEYGEYLDYGEWLGMGSVYFLAPSLDYDINSPIPEVRKLRDELFDKYKDEVAKGDSSAAEKIEREVLDLAEKKIKEKGNEAYDFYRCGIGAFANNYKKMSIMAGAIENPWTKKLDILKSNYIDGIDIKEYSKFANLTLVGGYSRGVETQSSGYERKKLDNALQTVVRDEAGTDCGTPFSMKIPIMKKISNLFLNRYIVENGKLKLLTEDNIKQYEGKEVNMRSPMFCKGKKLCNKCVGELFYKMGVENIGLLNDTMSGVLMNAAMKKMHDSTIKFSTISIKNYIIKH